jgi:thioredoxin
MVDQTVVRCPVCGQINRVDAEKVGQGLQPKCGNCRAPLVIVNNGPVMVSDATFRELVEKSNQPVLVDFWAPWCGPCHALAPTIEQLAKDFSGRIRVAKLNTDENPQIASRFMIQSIPTLILFLNGHELDRMIGVLPRHAIAGRIQSNLEKSKR